jgi:3'-phosphoadenosine 5'-phosphosulfate sulfotransferase (PAPS reductase)/FAD synthetase
MTTDNTHVFSCGGGVQSTAALVLAAQGCIPYRTFVFANVGDKAESPDTLNYIKQVLKPFANQHGIAWVDVAWIDRQGNQRDLYDDLMEQQRSINIPVFMPGGMPGNRKCTESFKIKPIASWIKRNAPGCILGKGISTDEPHRATPSRESDGYISAYPLIELGISRSDCLRIASEAGLPQPPKSSCWFCPFKTTEQWTRLRREKPPLFQSAVAIERTLQLRRQALGKDPVYLSGIGGRKQCNLDQVIPYQLGLFPEWLDEQDGCESGYCMT